MKSTVFTQFFIITVGPIDACSYDHKVKGSRWWQIHKTCYLLNDFYQKVLPTIPDLVVGKSNKYIGFEFVVTDEIWV